MSNKNRIIVFTRNPELGKVKTRLAKTLGDQSALDIYKFLLQHTEKTIRDLNYNKAIALDPNYFECLANRGAVYRTMKQYNLAIADYNAALSAKPNYEDALTNRANVYFETGKYQLAINDCSAALVSKPNNSNSLNTRAGAYLRLGEAELEPNKRQLYLQNALADYSILIAQNIRNSTAFTYRAYTYFLIKNKAAALNDIDAALAIDPKNQQAAALKQSILILN